MATTKYIMRGVGEIKNVRGKMWRSVVRDDRDNIVWDDKEKGDASMEDGSAERVFALFILAYPRDVLTNQDSINGTRLFSAIYESEHEKYLEIAENEWDWFVKKMEEDKVGVKVFGVSNHRVLRSMRDLEKEGEEFVKAKEAKASARKSKAQSKGEPEGDPSNDGAKDPSEVPVGS